MIDSAVHTKLQQPREHDFWYVRLGADGCAGAHTAPPLAHTAAPMQTSIYSTKNVQGIITHSSALGWHH